MLCSACDRSELLPAQAGTTATASAIVRPRLWDHNAKARMIGAAPPEDTPQRFRSCFVAEQSA